MNIPQPVEAPLCASDWNGTQRRPRLLVVDDQPVNIQALYQVFCADHQVLMATGGEQALAQCASQSPDLVLLDVVMPGMDGHTVCRRLKENPATRDIPVIFVTAHTEEAAEELGLRLGAVDFISKPINPTIVRARVGTHLTLKAQSDLLRQWACIDGLTGVHNRRIFDERLASEWARAARNSNPLSVVMLDVDYFKGYNDRYGHQAGDDCLRQIAMALRACLVRPADFLARYGGEEFVCLLPETGLGGAIQIAERIRQRILSLPIAHVDSAVAGVVTVSLGVSSTSEDAFGTAAALLREADAQLYLAKSSGRHKVCGAELQNVAGQTSGLAAAGEYTVGRPGHGLLAAH